MIIVDVGTLVHGIRAARELEGVKGALYHPQPSLRQLLSRLEKWPAEERPRDAEVLVSRDPIVLNAALDRWRSVVGLFGFRGFRFGELHEHVGMADKLFWWLVLDVSEQWLLRGIPQAVVLPARGVEIFRVMGRNEPVVRIPLVRHGWLWLTRSTRLGSEIEVANAALDVLSAYRRGSVPVSGYRHIMLPVFAGYMDEHATWLDGMRFRGAQMLGPVVQHVRCGLNLFGVPQSDGAGAVMSPASTLVLNSHLLAFVTPPSDPGTPYAVMSIGRGDWTQSW